VDCSDVMIHGYADGELDVAGVLTVEEHLRRCERCAREYDAIRAVQHACSADLLYHKLPPGLDRKVRAAVQRQLGRSAPRWTILNPRLAAAAVLLVAATLTGVIVLENRSSPDVLVAREIVSDHVRAMMLPEHHFDVASSDHHTVKPWFNGKVDFVPDVPDVSAAGFKLEGGRLEYIDGRPVAALMYSYRLHMIDLFTWPAPGVSDTSPSMSQRQGYWLAHWTHAGMTYWAITDAGQQTLHEFIQASTNTR